MRYADRALYRAKKTGKNRVELFWSDDSGPARPPTIEPEALEPAEPDEPEDTDEREDTERTEPRPRLPGAQRKDESTGT